MLRQKVILCIVAALVVVTPAIAEEDLFDTSEAAAHLEKGIDYLKAKQLDDAVSELEEAVSIYPDAESYYYLGYAYYLKGRSGDGESRKSSMENFERAYELDPNFSPNRLTPDSPPAALDAGTVTAPQPEDDAAAAPSSEASGEQQTDSPEEDAI